MALEDWVTLDSSRLAIRIAYDDLGRQQFVGETGAKYQNSPTLRKWRIKRIIYNGKTNQITTVLWAGSKNDFVWAWTEREKYSY